MTNSFFQGLFDTLYRVDTVYRNTGPWQSSEGPVLHREPIVLAAVRLADAGGIDGVSIRKVATELGVGPMRLYTHVSSKADLVALMVESVYAEIAAGLPGADAGDWRDRVRGVCRAFRAAAFRHEWFVDQLTGRPALGPAALTVLDATASAVAATAGRPDAGGIRLALSAVNAFLIGATRTDVAERRLDADDPAGAVGPGATVPPEVRRMLSEGRLPALERLVVEAVPADSATEFEWGLTALLDGIERLLATDGGQGRMEP